MGQSHFYIPWPSGMNYWLKTLMYFSLLVVTPKISEADDWAATLSRLKTLPAGFVAQCESVDLVLKGPPGYAKFRVQESKLCSNKGDLHLICIAGAAGTDVSGRSVPNCKDLSGDFT